MKFQPISPVINQMSRLNWVWVSIRNVTVFLSRSECELSKVMWLVVEQSPFLSQIEGVFIVTTKIVFLPVKHVYISKNFNWPTREWAKWANPWMERLSGPLKTRLSVTSNVPCVFSYGTIFESFFNNNAKSKAISHLDFFFTAAINKRRGLCF